MLAVRVGNNSVNLDALTHCQAHASQGVYARVMASYISWLAAGDNMACGLKLIPSRVESWRAATNYAHGRQADMMGRLDAALLLFLKFAQISGAIDQPKSEQLLVRYRQALDRAAKEHSRDLETADPVDRFLDLLRGQFIGGRAHLLSKQCGQPAEPLRFGWKVNSLDQVVREGTTVGWLDESRSEVMLDPDASFRMVHQASLQSGSPLGISQKSLHRLLKERRLLTRTDVDRNTFKATIAGNRKNVLVLSIETIVGPLESTNQDSAA